LPPPKLRLKPKERPLKPPPKQRLKPKERQEKPLPKLRLKPKERQEKKPKERRGRPLLPLKLRRLYIEATPHQESSTSPPTTPERSSTSLITDTTSDKDFGNGPDITSTTKDSSSYSEETVASESPLGPISTWSSESRASTSNCRTERRAIRVKSSDLVLLTQS